MLYFLGAKELDPKVSVNLIVCLEPVKASTFTETLNPNTTPIASRKLKRCKRIEWSSRLFRVWKVLDEDVVEDCSQSRGREVKLFVLVMQLWN